MDSNTATLRACIFLDKGGVGKTTSTAHLGVPISEEYDTLLIDLAGKQNDLAKQFGLWETIDENEDDWPNISTVFDEDWDTIAEKVPGAVEGMIYETAEGPDLLPAHKGLDQVDDELANIAVERRYALFDHFLTEHVEPLGYEVILVDLPGLTNNITLNGLWATRNVIAPVELGAFEEKQMDALLDDIDELDDSFDVVVSLAMVLPNRVDMRTNLARTLLDDLAEEHADALASTFVPQSQDIKNAQHEGRTVFALDEPSSTAQRARDAYGENAAALLDRLKQPRAEVS
jgi:chromosome partitioning protein